MAERIKIDELFDLCGQTKQRGVHDIRQESSQGLHVIAGFRWRRGRHPFIFSGLDEVVNFGVDYLKDTLLGRFLVIPKFLCCSQRY